MTHGMIETETKVDGETLVRMLKVRRPAGSKSERKFIREFIAPLGVETDVAGNLYKRIGEAPILWSCHTDTVHKQGGEQRIKVKGVTLSVCPSSHSNCLGADDTAGIWIMREMILAQRPGLYIFHRAEEIGGHGSLHFAKHNQHLLAGIQCAIAFDRRGTQDIITHQAMGRCCSDAFGKSLGTALAMKYENSSHGSFTDTANYTSLIGECTNVSVGYAHEHSAKEVLDYEHLLNLRDAVMRITPEKLTFERQPGECEWDDFDVMYGGRYYGQHGHHHNRPQLGWERPDEYETEEYRQRHMTLAGIVHEYPDEVADFLEQYGVSTSELIDHIEQVGASISRRRYR